MSHTILFLKIYLCVQCLCECMNICIHAHGDLRRTSDNHFYHSLPIPLKLCLFLNLDSYRMKPESPTDVPVSADLEAWVSGMCKTPSFIADRIQSKGS